MDIIQNISLLLEEQGKTKADLCRYLGIDDAVFSSWKSGRLKSYHKYLSKIARFLSTSVEYLKNESDEKYKEYSEEEELLKDIKVDEVIQIEQLDTLERIKYLLVLKKLSQKDLTNYLGISNNSFSEWLGKRSKSYLKYISHISKFLDTNVLFLLCESNDFDSIEKRTPLDIADIDEQFRFAFGNGIYQFPDEMKKEILQHLEYVKFKYKDYFKN